MTAVRYTATRSIIAGHSPDTLYELALTCGALTRSRNTVRRSATSMDGTEYSIRHRADIIWQVSLTPLDSTDLAAVNEFLDSVENAEVFEFDPYGSVGDSPDAYRDCVITGNSYTETRRVQRGDGGSGDFYTVAFQVREL